VKVLGAGPTRATHFWSTAALFMVIMVTTAMPVFQQVRHHRAQYTTGHCTDDGTLGAAGLIADYGTGRAAHDRAHHFIGEGASACQGQRQGQGREDFHSHDSHR
jgi:hypothetical protein